QWQVSPEMIMLKAFIILTACLSFSIPCICPAADEPHVVLITIDGFPAFMFWDAQTPIPRIRKLAAEGVASEGMRISNPTVTWPNHDAHHRCSGCEAFSLIQRNSVARQTGSAGAH